MPRFLLPGVFCVLPVAYYLGVEVHREVWGGEGLPSQTLNVMRFFVECRGLVRIFFSCMYPTCTLFWTQAPDGIYIYI